MAGSTDFRITVEGRGGHAGEPAQAIDPVVISAQIVLALQTLVSRETVPRDPAVVTVGRLSAGSVRNTIPQTATLEGTLRGFDEAVLRCLERGVERIAHGVAGAFGATAEVEIIPDTVPTVNDPRIAAVVRDVAGLRLGRNAVRTDPTLRTMAAEDIGFILERIPGAFFFVGAGAPGGASSAPHHSSRFDICEGSLPLAVEVMEAVALRILDELHAGEEMTAGVGDYSTPG